MMQRFEARQWVPFPVELVFAFFANPSNLAHMVPPKLKARIEDMRVLPPPERPVASDPARRFRSLAAGVGTEILLSLRPLALLPYRVRWVARIAEFEWNRHFVDEQARGPLRRFRHRHGVSAEMRGDEEGTLVVDTIEFEAPLGSMGTIWVRRQLDASFAFRHKRLPEILAAAARQAARTA